MLHADDAEARRIRNRWSSGSLGGILRFGANLSFGSNNTVEPFRCTLSRRAVLALALCFLAGVAACRAEQQSADSQTFELVLDDVSQLVSTKPEVNPSGYAGSVAADRVAERSRVLRRRNLKEVNDSVGHRGCPGTTTTYIAEEIRARCPVTPVSVVVVDNLVKGLQEEAAALTNLGSAPDPNLYSIFVSVYELASFGSQSQDYIYVIRFDGKRASIVQRVASGIS